MTARTLGLALAGMIGLAGCDATRTDSPQQPSAAPLSDVSATARPAGPAPRRVSTVLADTGFARAVNIAVLTNPDVRQSKSDILTAEASVLRASGTYLPSLSAGARAEQSLRSSGDDLVTPFLRVGQVIYDGGAGARLRGVANASLIEAQDELLVTSSTAALSAVEAYVDVMTTRRQLSLARQNETTHQRFLDMIEERSTSGVGAEVDLLTARSRMADAQSDTINAQSEVDRAIARYREIFNTGPVADAAPPRAPTLVAQGAAVIDDSPRMRAMDARLAAADAELAARQAERKPRVELGGTAEKNSAGDADVVFDLSVSYSFDTRREAQAAIDRASANVERLRAEKEALRREIRRSLDFVQSDRANGLRRIEAAERAVEANKANVATSTEQFSIARRTLLQLLDAQRDYQRSEQSLIAAEREYLLTGYEALALTGDITDVLGIEVDFTGASQ
ncbi:MAG: TolC family protein [Rhodobacteraceae bacterium]|nr:TolC family protein [Paracoccaceae bacterium]